ncbi:hypothetical protein MTR67_007090 [Solanum verrucosum]|uniref:Uncharacterized protein n=1 Tax=Solanum verrucosum TaxID=315347 RepID=A0AAF0THU5_SOLVR|nr:hypothetical protein MTR67_007090 [Solanum verrucosum]
MVFAQRGDHVLSYGGKLCVPNVDELPQKIMEESHSSRYYIPPGATKMFHDLKEDYLWSGTKMYISGFVAKSQNCQQVNDEHQRPCGVGQNIPLEKYKWEILRMNFIIVLPRSHMPLDSIRISLYDVVYGRRCRSLIDWFEFGAKLIGPNLIFQAMEKVKINRERLKTAQSRHKSYNDVIRRDLELEANDWVYLKVSSRKGVIWFAKKGKLIPRYIGPYQISKMVGNVAYELELPP